MTDEQLASLVLNDRELFGELMQRYEAALLRYVRRMGVASEDDRIDILQNSFIKAYRNILSFDTSLSFSAWIYRIAHNEAISYFRAKQVRPEGHLVANGEEIIALLHEESAITREVDNSIDRKRLDEALSQLDQKYRDILILRYFEDQNYREISDILKIPEGTVAVQINRGKKQLKTLLEKTSHLYE